MNRRTFLILSGGLLAAPLAAEAQQAAAPRIGWLVYGGTFSESSPGLDAAILRGLKERGYVDGKNLAIEYRYAEDGRLAPGADLLPAGWHGGESSRNEIVMSSSGGAVQHADSMPS